jgi:hypothetical protein
MLKRIMVLFVLILMPIYLYPILTIFWLLIRPLGSSDLRDAIEKSYMDLTRDIPRAWRIVLTGKE